jgi:DNA-binding protein HU-beta
MRTVSPIDPMRGRRAFARRRHEPTDARSIAWLLGSSSAAVASVTGDLTTEEDDVTKSELVDQVADRAGLTKVEAGRAVDAVLASVEDALRRGRDVTVAGFGKFKVSERAARTGVNPRTGERMQIAASRVPRFTAGSGLKSAVRGR